ncbi:MAG: hypothetical protein ABJE95_11780 [Byssovorax sp.]
MVEIKHKWIALAVAVGLSGCGQGGHPGEAAGRPAADPRSAAPLAASAESAPSSPPLSSAAALPASASAAAPASAAPVAITAPEPAVVEVRSPAIHTKLLLRASGKLTQERSFEAGPKAITYGQVPAERVEALHRVLVGAGFCALAPKQRESSSGYIIIEARFPDVSCAVELPDKRWDTDVKARKVMDAVRKLELEACPKGCKPDDSAPP